MKIEDGGIYDLLVTRDENGYMLPHPRVFRGVLVRKRDELLVATDQAGNEVTHSLVIRHMQRVPRATGPIYGVRASGSNAESFAQQSWVLFPAKFKN